MCIHTYIYLVFVCMEYKSEFNGPNGISVFLLMIGLRIVFVPYPFSFFSMSIYISTFNKF